MCAGAPGSRCSLQFPPIVKICENVLCVDVIIIVCVMWLNAQPIADSRLQIHSFEYSQWHLGWHFRKLKAQSSNVSFHRNVAKETLELELWAFENDSQSGISCTCTLDVVLHMCWIMVLHASYMCYKYIGRAVDSCTPDYRYVGCFVTCKIDVVLHMCWIMLLHVYWMCCTYVGRAVDSCTPHHMYVGCFVHVY